MLGIQPRPHLKPRPSLLDLIAQSNHRQQTSRPRSSPAPAPLPLPTTAAEALALPLPESPVKSNHHSHFEANLPPPAQSPRVRIKMPSKRQEDEAGEEYYGSVFSVSGPVIVAENMLGCAMYELVRLYNIMEKTEEPHLTPPGPRWS